MPIPRGVSPLASVYVARQGAAVANQGIAIAQRALAAQHEARRKAEFSRLQAEAHRITGDAAIEASKMAPEEAEGAFLQSTNDQIQALLERVQDEPVREALQERLPSIVESRRFSVASNAFRREVDDGRLDLSANVLPELARSFGRAQNDVEAEQALRDGRQSIGLSDYFSDAEKKELERNFSAAAQDARALHLIESGQLDAASRWVEDRESTPDLTDARRITLRNAITAEQGRASERVATDLEIKIDRSSLGADFGALEAEVEDLYSAKGITGAKRVQLNHKIDVARQNAQIVFDSRMRVLAAIDGELPLDFRNTDDKKAVTEFYSSVVAPIAKNAPPDERRTLLTEFSRSVNMIPEPLKGEIRAQLRGGSAAQAEAAADLLDSLRGANPQLLEDFANEDIALGMLVSSMVRGGVSSDEAVSRARESLRASPQERDARERRYRDEQWRDENLFEEIDDRLDIFGRDPEIPDRLRGEFEFLTRELYLGTGSIEVARDVAEQNLRRVWSVTEIGGKRWQRLAPEALYPEFGGSEPIHEQLIADMRAGAVVPEEFEDRVRLEPDDLTEREARPSYRVMMLSELGEWEPIRLKSGRYSRFVPDLATSPLAERQRAAVAQELEEDKALRERRLASRKFLAENPDLYEGLPRLSGSLR